MMLSKKSSASRWNACRKLSSKSGKSSEFGTLPRGCAGAALTRELLTKDESDVGEHPSGLRREHVGLLQLTIARAARISGSSGRRSRRKRQPRRQLLVRVRYGAQVSATRLGFGRKDERRWRECGADELKPSWKLPVPSPVRSTHEVVDLGRPCGTIRLRASEERIRRGTRFPAWRAEPSGEGGRQEEHARARRRSGRLRAEWTLNGDRLHVRCAFGVERIREIANETLQPIGLEERRGRVEKRGSDVALAGLDDTANAEPRRLERVGRVGRIGLQPDQICVAANRRVEDRPRRSSVRSSSCGVLETRIALRFVRYSLTWNSYSPSTGNVCPRAHAADRPSGKAFEVHVRERPGGRVGVAAGRDPRIANRHRADFLRAAARYAVAAPASCPGVGNVVEAERRHVR